MRYEVRAAGHTSAVGRKLADPVSRECALKVGVLDDSKLRSGSLRSKDTKSSLSLSSCRRVVHSRAMGTLAMLFDVVEVKTVRRAFRKSSRGYI
jgi:hypothetical protein